MNIHPETQYSDASALVFMQPCLPRSHKRGSQCNPINNNVITHTIFSINLRYEI